MSAVVPHFSQLSLASNAKKNMANTRSQSRRTSRRPSTSARKTRSTASSKALSVKPDSSSSSSSSSPLSFVAGQSHTYDNSLLSPTSWQQAQSAFTEPFHIALCSEKQADETYFAFEITPTPRQQTVRIGSPRSPYHQPTCSCPFYQSKQASCQHIFWLLDQLDSAPSSSSEDLPNRNVVPLPPSGPLSNTASSIYEHIAARGLHSLALERGWPYQHRDSATALPPPPRQTQTQPQPFAFGNEDFSEDDETTPDSTRLYQVRDILSTFDASGALPEDFLPLPATPLTPLASESLPQTLLNLSINSDAVFRSLRDTVPRDYCAARYFDKLYSLTLSTLTAAEASPPSGLGISGLDDLPDVSSRAPRVSPHAAAHRIREIERKLMHAAHVRAPFTEGTKYKALRVLVCGLDRVSRTENGELLGLLVDGNEDDEKWAVDSIWMFVDVARDVVEALEEIRDRLSQRGAPESYTRVLKGFVDAVRQMPSKRRRSPYEDEGAKRAR